MEVGGCQALVKHAGRVHSDIEASVLREDCGLVSVHTRFPVMHSEHQRSVIVRRKLPTIDEQRG